MEKLRLRRSARKDSQRIEKLVYDYYFSLVPKVFDIEEEETVCKKVVDKNGNIIAGCTGYIYPWGMMYIDDMWVDEKYRRQELGSNTLQAVEKVAEEKGCYLITLINRLPVITKELKWGDELFGHEIYETIILPYIKKNKKIHHVRLQKEFNDHIMFQICTSETKHTDLGYFIHTKYFEISFIMK